MHESIIHVENVSKAFRVYEVEGTGLLSTFKRRYYTNRALDSVSFDVKKGEILALLGRNGSGKSTMVKILMGILAQDSGSVAVLGMDPYRDRLKVAMQTGFVLGAHPQLYTNIPAIDTLEFIKVLYKIPDTLFEKRLAYLTDLLGIRDVSRRQVRVLSLGERMKCNFLAAVLHDPKVVLLDEPTIGVDLPSRTVIANTILEMRKRSGSTFVLTTHVVDDILIADRIVLLDKGRKLFDGDSHKIRELTKSKLQVDLYFKKDVTKGFSRFGRVIGRRNGNIRLEVDPSTLKSSGFIKLLQSDELLDYRVAEPGLGYVLNTFYGAIGKRRR